MNTQIYCDIADYKIIKKYSKYKIVKGFTTNPSLMRLAGAKNYKDYSLKILKISPKAQAETFVVDILVDGDVYEEIPISELEIV